MSLASRPRRAVGMIGFYVWFSDIINSRHVCRCGRGLNCASYFSLLGAKKPHAGYPVTPQARRSQAHNPRLSLGVFSFGARYACLGCVCLAHCRVHATRLLFAAASVEVVCLFVSKKIASAALDTSFPSCFVSLAQMHLRTPATHLISSCCLFRPLCFTTSCLHAAALPPTLLPSVVLFRVPLSFGPILIEHHAAFRRPVRCAALRVGRAGGAHGNRSACRRA